jgi:hypothetical protein
VKFAVTPVNTISEPSGERSGCRMDSQVSPSVNTVGDVPSLFATYNACGAIENGPKSTGSPVGSPAGSTCVTNAMREPSASTVGDDGPASQRSSGKSMTGVVSSPSRSMWTMLEFAVSGQSHPASDMPA